MERLLTDDPFTIVIRDSLQYLHILRLEKVPHVVDLSAVRKGREIALAAKEATFRYMVRGANGIESNQGFPPHRSKVKTLFPKPR
jgi:hypothetical protein